MAQQLVQHPLRILLSCKPLGVCLCLPSSDDAALGAWQAMLSKHQAFPVLSQSHTFLVQSAGPGLHNPTEDRDSSHCSLSLVLLAGEGSIPLYVHVQCTAIHISKRAREEYLEEYPMIQLRA